MMSSMGRYIALTALLGAFLIGFALPQSTSQTLDGDLYPIEAAGFTDYASTRTGASAFRVEGNGGAFAEGVAIVTRKERVSAIRLDGAQLFSKANCSCYPFSEGVAVVTRKGGVAGGGRVQSTLIDRNGTELFPFRDIVISRMSEGLAACGKSLPDEAAGESLYGFIDRSGAWIITPRFRRVADFSEGVAAVSVNGREVGFIHKDGTWAIRPRFSRNGTLASFQEGLAPVMFGGQVGFINFDDKFVVPPQFHEAGNFSGGLAPACIENQNGLERFTWGYVDKTGKFEIPPSYQAAREFAGKAAVVKHQGRWRLINQQGQLASELRFQKIVDYNNSIRFAVTEEFDQGFLRSNGSFIRCCFQAASALTPVDELYREQIHVGATQLEIEAQYGRANKVEDRLFTSFSRKWPPVPLSQLLPSPRQNAVVRQLLYFRRDNSLALWLIRDDDRVWRVFADVEWGRKVELHY